jgi:hypothetical protein
MAPAAPYRGGDGYFHEILIPRKNKPAEKGKVMKTKVMVFQHRPTGLRIRVIETTHQIEYEIGGNPYVRDGLKKLTTDAGDPCIPFVVEGSEVLVVHVKACFQTMEFYRVDLPPTSPPTQQQIDEFKLPPTIAWDKLAERIAGYLIEQMPKSKPSTEPDLRNVSANVTDTTKSNSPYTDPGWLLDVTHSVHYNPNCACPFQVRLVNPKLGRLDNITHGETKDIEGFGKTLAEAATNALTRRNMLGS